MALTAEMLDYIAREGTLTRRTTLTRRLNEYVISRPGVVLFMIDGSDQRNVLPTKLASMVSARRGGKKIEGFAISNERASWGRVYPIAGPIQPVVDAMIAEKRVSVADYAVQHARLYPNMPGMSLFEAAAIFGTVALGVSALGGGASLFSAAPAAAPAATAATVAPAATAGTVGSVVTGGSLTDAAIAAGLGGTDAITAAAVTAGGSAATTGVIATAGATTAGASVLSTVAQNASSVFDFLSSGTMDLAVKAGGTVVTTLTQAAVADALGPKPQARQQATQGGQTQGSGGGITAIAVTALGILAALVL